MHGKNELGLWKRAAQLRDCLAYRFQAGPEIFAAVARDQHQRDGYRDPSRFEPGNSRRPIADRADGQI